MGSSKPFVRSLLLLPRLFLATYCGSSFVKVLNTSSQPCSLAFRTTSILRYGIKLSIIESGEILSIKLGISLPIGILSGVDQAEARANFSQAVSFLTDVHNGIHSIVIGLFVYAIWILPYALMHPGQGYSRRSGGASLGIMLIPLVMRTTDEMLRQFPQSLWDASLAMRTPIWRTMLLVVLSAARNGIVTGVMLALARVAGEIALISYRIGK